MTIYMIAGLAILSLTGLFGLAVFAFYSGRNSDAIKTMQKNRDNAETMTRITQKMAETGANTLRSDEQLSETLEKGEF